MHSFIHVDFAWTLISAHVPVEAGETLPASSAGCRSNGSSFHALVTLAVIQHFPPNSRHPFLNHKPSLAKPGSLMTAFMPYKFSISFGTVHPHQTSLTPTSLHHRTDVNCLFHMVK